MSDPIYDIGTRRYIGRSWTLADGSPADPDYISITVREPDGAKSKFLKSDLTSPGVGRWVVPWVFRKPGRHVFTIETTGNVEKTDEYFVQARRRQGYPPGESVIATGRVSVTGFSPTVVGS